MRKPLASSFAVVIAVAALAACGGGGGSSKAQDTLPLPTQAPSSAQGLANLVAHAAQQRYKITFTDQSGTSQSYAQDGTGNSAQIALDSETFVTKTATINCDKTSSNFVCTKSPRSIVGGNPLFGVLSLEQTQLSALGGNLGGRSNKTIAGRDAQCITFAPKDLVGDTGTATIPEALLNSKATYTYCVDKATGVTLEVSGTNDAGTHTTSLEVTKFEQPIASDFVPPATLTP
jgi:hypothetical protein